MRNRRLLFVCAIVQALAFPAAGLGQDWSWPGGQDRSKSKSGLPYLDFKGEINPCWSYTTRYDYQCSDPKSAQSKDCKELRAYINSRCRK